MAMLQQSQDREPVLIGHATAVPGYVENLWPDVAISILIKYNIAIQSIL